MIEPDVTCVIPTFNDRVNLRRAVASVLAQTGVTVEVVLVDDCSNAETRDFIAALAREDDRITTFFLPQNGGQARARNIGAMLARSQFIAFLDQDDEHAADWYRYAVADLKANPQRGGLSGEAVIVDIPPRFGIDGSDLRLRGLSLVFITNIVFRRSAFLASGGFPTGPLWRTKIAGEDGTFRHGFARNWRAAQCPRPAVIHRAKEGGATVFFLDRSTVEAGRVVITRLEEIEKNGQLRSAQEEFWARARRIALEVRDCANPAAAGTE